MFHPVVFQGLWPVTNIQVNGNDTETHDLFQCCNKKASVSTFGNFWWSREEARHKEDIWQESVYVQTTLAPARWRACSPWTICITKHLQVLRLLQMQSCRTSGGLFSIWHRYTTCVLSSPTSVSTFPSCPTPWKILGRHVVTEASATPQSNKITVMTPHPTLVKHSSSLIQDLTATLTTFQRLDWDRLWGGFIGITFCQSKLMIKVRTSQNYSDKNDD